MLLDFRLADYAHSRNELISSHCFKVLRSLKSSSHRSHSTLDRPHERKPILRMVEWVVGRTCRDCLIFAKTLVCHHSLEVKLLIRPFSPHSNTCSRRQSWVCCRTNTSAFAYPASDETWAPMSSRARSWDGIFDLWSPPQRSKIKLLSNKGRTFELWSLISTSKINSPQREIHLGDHHERGVHGKVHSHLAPAGWRDQSITTASSVLLRKNKSHHFAHSLERWNNTRTINKYCTFYSTRRTVRIKNQYLLLCTV